MVDVKVVMKDGRKFCGPLWLWRPKLGWFTLVLDQMHYSMPIPGRLFLMDVESAIEAPDRGNDERNLLIRAVQDGWIKPENKTNQQRVDDVKEILRLWDDGVINFGEFRSFVGVATGMIPGDNDEIISLKSTCQK